MYASLLCYRSLCEKFPRKHGIMLNFLASMLRDEVRFMEPRISELATVTSMW